MKLVNIWISNKNLIDSPSLQFHQHSQWPIFRFIQTQRANEAFRLFIQRLSVKLFALEEGWPNKWCWLETVEESMPNAPAAYEQASRSCPPPETFIFQANPPPELILSSGSYKLKTSQELRMLSPSLFIQGSQCKC